MKLIKEDKGIELDFHKLGYEDHKVYELIASGDCEAVFQLESGGMKKFMAQLQPDNLEDVVAGISMYRPGPMQFIDLFWRANAIPKTCSTRIRFSKKSLKTPTVVSCIRSRLCKSRKRLRDSVSAARTS